MTYLWLKAAHVVAIILFAGGLTALLIGSFVVGTRGSAATASAGDLRAAVRRWDLTITQPALLATWALGLWLAFSGGWFSETWMQLKLLLVLALSGFHGVLAGRLRRVDLDAPDSREGVPAGLVASILLALAGVAILVIVKPF